MVGFETAFSLGYEQLVLTKELRLADYIARLTIAPARILNLPIPKTEPGGPADLLVLDLKESWTYTPDRGPVQVRQLALPRPHPQRPRDQRGAGRYPGQLLAPAEPSLTWPRGRLDCRCLDTHPRFIDSPVRA